MSVRRKGRELALMVLYALDGVPSFEIHDTQKRFWALFDDGEVWNAFLTPPAPLTHPLEEPPLWQLFDRLSLVPSESSAPPPFEMARQVSEFAQARIDGVLEKYDQIDEAISLASRGWRIQRMAQVDRNILRLGVYEILCCDDIPGPVIINEALELSKRFSSQESRPFINGVLDRILRSRQKNSPPQPTVMTRPSRNKPK
jgi:transcription antitermination factor NusB